MLQLLAKSQNKVLAGLVLLLMALQGAMLLAVGGSATPPLVPLGYLSHLLLEILCVIVAAGVFAIGWSSRFVRTLQPFIVLACGFCGVAILDLAHILSMPGMPDYLSPNTRSKAVLFWLSARYLTALTLLLAVWLAMKRREAHSRTLWPWRYFSLLAVLLYVVVIHAFALETAGERTEAWLAQARYGFQGGVVVLHLICVAVMLRKFRSTPLFHPQALFSAVCIMAMSDAFFLVYRSAVPPMTSTACLGMFTRPSASCCCSGRFSSRYCAPRMNC